NPFGVAVAPDNKKLYVGDLAGRVSVIDTASNTATAIITVGGEPGGVAVTPDGSKVYVANIVGDASVIGTDNNNVIATIPIGDSERERLIQTVARRTSATATRFGS